MRALLLLPALALVACGDSSEASRDNDPDTDDDFATETVRSVRDAISDDADGFDLATEVPGRRVETITTTDGGLDFGLTDEVLWSSLSEATRAEALADMESETKDEEGLGGAIARAVTGAVAEGLSTVVTVPLDRVRDLRFEDGRLVIDMADGEPSPFETTKSDDEPMLSQFAPADAQRLADAFSKLRR